MLSHRSVTSKSRGHVQCLEEMVIIQIARHNECTRIYICYILYIHVWVKV